MITKRLNIENNSLSVIIPCISGDAVYLKNLLEIYTQQTILPKEIIISLSGVKHFDDNQINNFKKEFEKNYPFILKTIYHQDNLYAGENRNSAVNISSGDILVTQDADDIPHIQRLEIIKYFFDNYDIIQLCHDFIFRNNIKDIINSQIYKRLKYNSFHNISQISFCNFKEANSKSFRITNGEMAVKKEIWIKHPQDPKKKRAEDLYFNSTLQDTYTNIMYIKPKLIIYNYDKKPWSQDDQTMFNII